QTCALPISFAGTERPSGSDPDGGLRDTRRSRFFLRHGFSPRRSVTNEAELSSFYRRWRLRGSLSIAAPHVIYWTIDARHSAPSAPPEHDGDMPKRRPESHRLRFSSRSAIENDARDEAHLRHRPCSAVTFSDRGVLR